MTTTSSRFAALPTTTIHAVRLCLFQPTRRPIHEDRVIATPGGKIRRFGKLGQQHADVLEAFCYEREKKEDMEDGRIKLLVDPARVRRTAGQLSGSTFERVLTELQAGVVEIIEPAKFACQGHMIDHINKATRSDGTPITRHDPFTGRDRPLWRVELGKALCTLVAGDMWLGYDPTLIARLPHGISGAITRHILTHRNQPRGGWHIDTLIRAVAGDLPDQQLRDRRREIYSDAAALAALGVIVNNQGRILVAKGAK